MKGLVLQSTGSWYMVEAENGDCIKCRTRGSMRMKGFKTTNPVAVGDEVMYELEQEKGSGVITSVLPRKNYIIRQSTNLSKLFHIVASNLDQGLLILSLKNPSTLTGFIDRFLVTSEAYGIPTILVFNKTDIYGEKEKEELAFLTKVYENAGYKVLTMSTTQPETIKPIEELIKNKTTLLSGYSGVGKSSIINLLDPSFTAKTGDVSEANEKGKHTTTFAEMYKLDEQTRIIDTPGIKSFGLAGVKKEEVAQYFPEFFKLSESCRFANCTHEKEPGCAVKEALLTNELLVGRYKNYLDILASDHFREDWQEI
jgi:ribosome biogenesis GTPase